MDVTKVQFDILMKTAADGIIVVGSTGLMKAYNPACERLFGYTAAEAINQNVKMLMPTPYGEEHDQYIANYHATGEKKIIGIGREVVGRHKDGSIFPMYLSVGEGRLEGVSIFVGIIHDLTDRERAERQLKDLQSELLHVSRLSDMGQLASALAHELNQPLTAVTNYVKAASRTLGPSDKNSLQVVRAQELMEKAKEQTLRAGQIVKRLRDFIAKGETQHTKENLNEVIEEALVLALVGAAESGVTVQRKFAAGLPTLLIDKIQIQQVVLNLVRNSVEALQDVQIRHICISTSVDTDLGAVAVAVSDSGAGLAPKVLDQLFQPFVTTKQGGMGVGLSICKSIVDAHGGQLSAEPKDGGGVIFQFHLPISEIPREE
jgi:two-component system, LuxR family, sensor kinase FixL